MSVGYVDVYIENGGLIGDIANSQFRVGAFMFHVFASSTHSRLGEDIRDGEIDAARKNM